MSTVNIKAVAEAIHNNRPFSMVGCRKTQWDTYQKVTPLLKH